MTTPSKEAMQAAKDLVQFSIRFPTPPDGVREDIYRLFEKVLTEELKSKIQQQWAKVIDRAFAEKWAAAENMVVALQGIADIGREFYDMDCGDNGLFALHSADEALRQWKECE